MALGRMTNGKLTVGILKVGIMTLGISKLSITILSMMNHIPKLNISGSQHSNTQCELRM
jgi:hypothetical protein